MMKSAKSKIFFSMAGALLLALTSCGGGNGGTTSSSATPSSSSQISVDDLHSLTADITFWSTMGKTNIATLTAQIAEFNKIFPNISVTHTAQGGYDELKAAVSSAIPAGTTPTMAYCYSDHVAEYLAADAVLNMDKYINDPVYGLGVADCSLGDLGKDDFIEGYWEDGCHYSIDGQPVEGTYSLPYSKSTEVMFYNKTAFAANHWEVPTTWDELWALCKTIKETEKYKDSTPFGYDADANWYISLSEQLDIPYTTAEGSNHYLFVNDDAKNKVKELKGYFDKGYFATQNTLGSGTYTSTKFAAQELFMSVGSTGGTKYNYDAAFETGVAAVPQSDLFSGKVLSQGPSVCFFNSATKNQRLAAWLLYKFLTNTTNSAVYSVLTGYNPVRKSSFASPIYTDRGDVTGVDKLIKDVADFLGDDDCAYNDWYFSSPAFKGSSVAREQVGGIFGTVFNTKIEGEVTLDKVVDDAFDYALQKCQFAG